MFFCTAFTTARGRRSARGPDDDAAATFALIIGRTGAVSTITLRAFPEADYRRLVKALR